MFRMVAILFELAVLVCALWALSFLSTVLHEFGHALGYMLATGDTHWHIRVGWGKRLLNVKALTVNLLVFDGLFSPAEGRIDTKAKLIMMLSGGPIISLVLVVALLLLRFSGAPFYSDAIAQSAIVFFINTALFINGAILLLSILPVHYFWGEVKGMESDGLQIIHAMKA